MQNNLTYINEGNIDLFGQEQQLCQDYETRSLNVEQMCFNGIAQQHAEADIRHEQMASELTGFMMSRAIAEQEILNMRKRTH